MSRHLKSIIIARLEDKGMCFTSLPSDATPHTRGVRYFHPARGIATIQGAMDHYEEGQKYKKRIVVRPSRFRKGLHELYTYHFPTHWSAACVANRELIKEAQRQAHALEHDHSIEALEWRVRFFHHYFRVFRDGEKPEPGLKPYSRFYQYTYVAIYRQLKEEAAKAKEKASLPEAYLRQLAEEVSFEPIVPKRRNLLRLHPADAIKVTSHEIAEDDRSVIRYHWPPDDIGSIEEIYATIERVRHTVREAAEDEGRHGKEQW